MYGPVSRGDIVSSRGLRDGDFARTSCPAVPDSFASLFPRLSIFKPLLPRCTYMQLNIHNLSGGCLKPGLPKSAACLIGVREGGS